MSSTTRTVALNAAFLQEIKEDNIELRRLLTEAGQLFDEVSLPLTPFKTVVDLLSELRDQLAMHFSLEEAYGYFDDAVNVAPRLSDVAAQLREDHEQLFNYVCDLVEQAERLLYQESTASAVQTIAQQFLAFRHRFQDHEYREDELILQSLDDDIGVGD